MFIHSHAAGQAGTASIGNFNQIQQVLNLSIFTVSAMQGNEYHLYFLPQQELNRFSEYSGPVLVSVFQYPNVPPGSLR